MKPDWLSRWYAALGSLPSNQFRVVCVTVMDFLTFALLATVFLVDMLANRKISETAVTIFQGWLFLLAGLHGFNLGSYGIKRGTWRPGAPDGGGPGNGDTGQFPVVAPVPQVTTVVTDKDKTTTTTAPVGS